MLAVALSVSGRPSAPEATSLSVWTSLGVPSRLPRTEVEGRSSPKETCVDFPFCDSSADAVVSIQVLEHLLDKRGALRMIQEMHLVLKPKGMLYLTVYNFHVYDRVLRRRTIDRPDHRFIRYTPKAIRDLVSEVFGAPAPISVRPQCLFLRRGERPLQRFRGLESQLSRSAIGTPLASFLVYLRHEQRRPDFRHHAEKPDESTARRHDEE
jgi:SAM-dependent methyltransferase